jgi:sulfonate transport system permease protein
MTQTLAAPTRRAPAVALAPTAPKRRRLGPGKPLPYGRAAGPLLVILVWSVASAAGWLDPRVLSAPWTVVETGIELVANGKLPDSVLASVRRAGLGFLLGAVVGTSLAIAAGLSRVSLIGC